MNPGQRRAIAKAAAELNRLRETWLNPPEWTREDVLLFPGSTNGPWARLVRDPNDKGLGTVQYTRRLSVDDRAAEALRKRTLTKLYNERPAWLDTAHRALDEAVFAAYGWATDLDNESLLARLLALNADHAAGGQEPLRPGSRSSR